MSTHTMEYQKKRGRLGHKMKHPSQKEQDILQMSANNFQAKLKVSS